MKWTKTHITNQNNTSSTAQGSGGSFKDRKLIGVVCCCESWMAEQTHWWIERWVECRAIYLSICLPASLKAKLFWENPCVFDFDNIKNEAILRNCPLCRACHATCIFAPSMVCFFHILTSKIASRHNGLRFLLTAQLPEAEVFLAFWLGNLLRATTACNFSSLIWPDGSAPAALPSLLFDTPGPQIIEKHGDSRLSYLFLTLSFLWPSFFFSSLVWLFPPLLSICPYCRKFDF